MKHTLTEQRLNRIVDESISDFLLNEGKVWNTIKNVGRNISDWANYISGNEHYEPKGTYMFGQYLDAAGKCLASLFALDIIKDEKNYKATFNETAKALKLYFANKSEYSNGENNNNVNIQYNPTQAVNQIIEINKWLKKAVEEFNEQGEMKPQQYNQLNKYYKQFYNYASAALRIFQTYYKETENNYNSGLASDEEVIDKSFKTLQRMLPKLSDKQKKQFISLLNGTYQDTNQQSS